MRNLEKERFVKLLGKRLAPGSDLAQRFDNTRLARGLRLRFEDIAGELYELLVQRIRRTASFVNFERWLAVSVGQEAKKLALREKQDRLLFALEDDNEEC